MRVKICGLMDPAAVAAAADAGAAYLGFVMFPPSPRSLGAEAVRALALAAPPGVVKVALAVDPDDALVELLAGLPIDMVQLHGQEPPDRVAAIRARTGLPAMKAIGVREAADLEAVARYAPVADQLLIDAKPPKGATRPGGNALAVDWRLLAGRRWPRPWMLAGGLTPENVSEAVAVTGAAQLDVSSGVESAPGVKDPDRIRAFLAAAGRAGAPANLRGPAPGRDAGDDSGHDSGQGPRHGHGRRG
ncbi:phosphoribosylanthranilate isomerase [Paralimibaculum aggregatum]|uniref:N-(5'-phosphoribosyl)anthranilate isomerase n=1 Tax=Paralimibaculum aggregatum TaxID=3036245 RepID=A0ABQ6LFS1_9RHOB|nr:phosphoribosylanthranilate isomerase [Limibaculum sp. NKW23]